MQGKQKWCGASLKHHLQSLSGSGILSHHVLWRLPFHTVKVLIESGLTPEQALLYGKENFWEALFVRRWHCTHGLGAISQASELMGSTKEDFLPVVFGRSASPMRDFERLSRESHTATYGVKSFVLFSVPPGVYGLKFKDRLSFSPLTNQIRTFCLRIHKSCFIPITVTEDTWHIRSFRGRCEATEELYFYVDRFSTLEYLGDGLSEVSLQRLPRPTKAQKNEARRRYLKASVLQGGQLSSQQYFAHPNEEAPDPLFRLMSGLACWWPSNSGFNLNEVQVVDICHSPFGSALRVVNGGTGIFTIFEEVLPGRYDLSARVKLELPEAVSHIQFPYYLLKRRRDRPTPKSLPPFSQLGQSDMQTDKLVEQWMKSHVEKVGGEYVTKGGRSRKDRIGGTMKDVTGGTMKLLTDDDLCGKPGCVDVKIKIDKFVEVRVATVVVSEVCDVQIGLVPEKESDYVIGSLSLLEESTCRSAC